jgi:hypothetical protein
VLKQKIVNKSYIPNNHIVQPILLNKSNRLGDNGSAAAHI